MIFGPRTAADLISSRAPEQLLQGVRGRLAVVMQQPEPFDPLRGRQPGRAGTGTFAARCCSARATAAP